MDKVKGDLIDRIINDVSPADIDAFIGYSLSGETEEEWQERVSEELRRTPISKLEILLKRAYK